MTHVSKHHRNGLQYIDRGFTGEVLLLHTISERPCRFIIVDSLYLIPVGERVHLADRDGPGDGGNILEGPLNFQAFLLQRGQIRPPSNSDNNGDFPLRIGDCGFIESLQQVSTYFRGHKFSPLLLESL